jgi:hypothetical protein
MWQLSFQKDGGMRINSKPVDTAEIAGLQQGGRLNLPPGAAAPPTRIAVVTITWARSSAEADCLRASLDRLSQVGLPVFVGDGGSPDQFLTRIRRLPNLRISPLPDGTRHSLVNQVRTAIAEAQHSNPDYLLYTEPDKRSFFSRGLPRLLDAAQKNASSPPALIIAARTPRGFGTFPRGQRVAERFMNGLCSEALGQVGDYTYGPMLISARLLRNAPLIPENLGWGWRFFLMAVAHQLRLPIQLCTVPNQCPRAQRSEDSARARDYRLRQLVENVTGLANGWTALLDQPTEPIPSFVEAA